MTHGSLFSGIGGFDLAAEWMEWENVFHCEWNEFGQRVLKYYWPKAISYNDITKTDFSIHRGKIDIVTGGFPCQPYSSAGKRKGKEDERHLWPEMLRAIGEIQPSWVVGENVLGLTNWNGGLVFNEVQDELEAKGYEVQPFILPASGVNAPHERYRVWFIAYARCFVRSQSIQSQINGKQTLRKRIKEVGCKDREFAKMASSFGEVFEERMDSSYATFANDGFPSELDGITIHDWTIQSLKASGNSVVPQLVHKIFKAIEQYNLISQ